MGGWQGPQQLRARGGSSGGEAQVLRQQPAIDGIPRAGRAGTCKLRPELRDAMMKNSEERSIGGHQYRILRGALDDGYFGQPDNKEVDTKENVSFSSACLCDSDVILSELGRYNSIPKRLASSSENTHTHARANIHTYTANLLFDSNDHNYPLPAIFVFACVQTHI